VTKSTTSLARKLLLTFASLALFATACGGGGPSKEQSKAAEAAAETNEAQLQLTSDLATSQFLDTVDGEIVDLGDVVTGDRAVLLWYWAPHWPTCRRHAGTLEQFALDNKDTIQVIGVGSQDDFEQAQDFLRDTGLDDVEMLWEGSGNIWGLNRVRTNSAMQLFSYDLSQGSQVVAIVNDQNLELLADSAGQAPWVP